MRLRARKLEAFPLIPLSLCPRLRALLLLLLVPAYLVLLRAVVRLGVLDLLDDHAVFVLHLHHLLQPVLVVQAFRAELVRVVQHRQARVRVLLRNQLDSRCQKLIVFLDQLIALCTGLRVFQLGVAGAKVVLADIWKLVDDGFQFAVVDLVEAISMQPTVPAELLLLQDIVLDRGHLDHPAECAHAKTNKGKMTGEAYSKLLITKESEKPI